MGCRVIHSNYICRQQAAACTATFARKCYTSIYVMYKNNAATMLCHIMVQTANTAKNP